MATWRSVRTIEYGRDMGGDYAQCKKTWQYNTTSDTLTLQTHIGAHSDILGFFPESVTDQRMGQDEALAVLEALMDWAETYCGEGSVQNLIEKIKKDKD